MLSKSEILITKRFLFSKKSEGYVSIFSWFSIIGISLGVAAIIIVMSVMNGFRSNLTERLLGVNSHLNLYSFNEKINLEEINLLKTNLDSGDYEQLLPSIETQGLVINNKISRGVIIRGYEYLNFDHYLYDQIITEKLNSINFNQIVIGDAFAKALKLQIGDKLKLAIPKTAPIKPIAKPIRKNTFKIPILLNPNVLSMAISLFFSLTKITKPEIIFIEATMIIRVRIKNITFFSTFKAFIKDEFLSTHERE